MPNFNIPLNGSNHVSKERHQAFEEALNDNHVIKYVDESGTELHNVETAAAKANSPQAGARQHSANRDMNHDQESKISPELINHIEMSLKQSFAHQNRTMDIHQEYLDQHGDYTQIIKEILDQQGKILVNGNPESNKALIDALQRSLDNFHQVREKGMEVHQQFLSLQADFSQSFVRVLEKQHGLVHAGHDHSAQAPPETEAHSGSIPPSQKPPLEFVVNPDPVVIDYQPKTEEPVRAQQATLPATTISPEILAEALLRIVGEKTGYPPEMLELEMDLEADLGIDSIKRVEILGAIEEEFPSLPQADTEILSQTRTLEEIVDYLKSESSQSTTPSATESKTDTTPANTGTPEENPAPVSIQDEAAGVAGVEGYSTAELTSVLLEIVAEKTGYPAEMLELGMDLEADLGIDSIKRVEILGAMEDRVPGLPQVETESLAELRTLEEIVTMMSSVQNSPMSQVDAGSESKKKDSQPSTLDTTPVTLTSLPRADYLEFAISPDHPVILTDEGTDFTLQLANTLLKEGWKVLLWSYSGLSQSRKVEINPEIIQIKVDDISPESLNEQLVVLRNRYNSFSGFIHLHPPSEMIEGQDVERDFIKMVFFLAGALKEDLTTLTEAGRPIFMTVTRINGKLGLGPVKEFQEGSGLTGMVKALSWEWPGVFTRAIDLDPDLDIQKQVEFVIQEIHDPDQGLIEVGLTQDNRFSIEREGFGIS